MVRATNDVSESYANSSIRVVCDVAGLDTHWVTYPYNGEANTEMDMTDAFDHDGFTRRVVLGDNYSTYFYIATRYHQRSIECGDQWLAYGPLEYWLNPSSANYTTAESTCEAAQASLLVPQPDITNWISLLHRLLGSISPIYLGAKRLSGVPTFLWADGSGSLDPNDATFAPLFATPGSLSDDHVILDTNGLLSTNNGHANLPYVCQRVPYPARRFVAADPNLSLHSGTPQHSPLVIRFPAQPTTTLYNVITARFF